MPITQICNITIQVFHFPKECKEAKLKPLHKKCTKTNPETFRSISLLLRVTQFMEKVVLDQNTSYLTENNLLFKYQSGFHKNHSVDTSFSYLTDKKSTGFDSGQLTGMILIHLQKSFDTINQLLGFPIIRFFGFNCTFRIEVFD